MTGDETGTFPGRVEMLPAGGWRVVLSLRAEQVSASKRTVVYEEVDIRRELVEDVTAETQTVKREQLEVQASGDLETERLPAEHWRPASH